MAGMFGCFKCKKSGRPAGTTPPGSCSSDVAAMASGPSDVTANQEAPEVQEECPGKKKSRFQTFKKFFARKKRKERSPSGADAGLKASQSSDDVSKASENDALTRSEQDKSSGSKVSLGSKALSHDSVFVSDSSEANEALGASQDSIHGKVKSLQLQLQQAIRLGSPPSLICMKGREDAGAMSEDDGLPCSPPEYTNLHTVVNQAQRNGSVSLEREDDDLSCAASSRAGSPLLVPGDFTLPASPFGCLDNSAAKHKMGLRHKACNKRKPVTRLEMKPEADEELNASKAEASVEQQQSEDAHFNELNLTVQREEDAEEGEEEEEEKKEEDAEEGEEEEEEEEGGEESEPEQDVSNGPDAFYSPQTESEENVSDSQPLPSSEDGSRASTTPPAGPREHSLRPPGILCSAEENRDEHNLTLKEDEDRDVETGGEEEEEVEKEEEEEEEEKEEEEEEEEEGEEEGGGESSLLQEVLSSLKTPLSSCSLGLETDDDVLKMHQEATVKEADTESEIEEGEEMREEEPGVDGERYRAAPPRSLSLGPTDEEEATPPASCEEHHVPEEQLIGKESEIEEEEAGDQLSPHRQHEDEKEEVKSEEDDDELVKQTLEEEADEDYQSEGEEEAIELEKEPEPEEEGREKTEEPEGGALEAREDKETVEEAEEAVEEERDDAEEMIQRFPDGDQAQVAPPLQETDVGVDVVAVGDAVCTSELPEEDGEECPAEEGFTNNDRSPDREDEAGEMEASEQREPQGDKEGEDQESDPPEPKTTSPSRTSTTTIHINLYSPSSDKASCFFQQPPAAPSKGAAGGDAATTEEEEIVEIKEADEAPPSPPVEQKPSESDQRKRGLTPPTDPPSAEGSAGEEVELPAAGVEPVQLMLSPGRVRSVGSIVKPRAPGGPDGSDVAAEGNSDGPFGVRLRKTLHRFSSEEEGTEPTPEAPPQPSSCKAEPIGVKPLTTQPVNTKPALPRKPDVHGDAGARSSSEAAAGRGGPAGSASPSWISVAKQKQKIYKESSLEEIALKKEEPERKRSLPAYVSSSRGQSCSRAAEPASKVSLSDVSKPSASVEKETRRAPGPAQCLSPPCPVPPKPQVLPTLVRPQAPRSLSPPTPVPVYQKSPSCTSKQPQDTTVASPPPPSSSAGSRAPGTSGPPPTTQRGLPAPALAQDEPPWMALAKKKAKAWSEMPQIVQ